MSGHWYEIMCWLNSLDVPSALLTSDISDLRSGMVLLQVARSELLDDPNFNKELPTHEAFTMVTKMIRDRLGKVEIVDRFLQGGTGRAVSDSDLLQFALLLKKCCHQKKTQSTLSNSSSNINAKPSAMEPAAPHYRRPVISPGPHAPKSTRLTSPGRMELGSSSSGRTNSSRKISPKPIRGSSSPSGMRASSPSYLHRKQQPSPSGRGISPRKPKRTASPRAPSPGNNRTGKQQPVRGASPRTSRQSSPAASMISRPSSASPNRGSALSASALRPASAPTYRRPPSPSSNHNDNAHVVWRPPSPSSPASLITASRRQPSPTLPIRRLDSGSATTTTARPAQEAAVSSSGVRLYAAASPIRSSSIMKSAEAHNAIAVNLTRRKPSPTPPMRTVTVDSTHLRDSQQGKAAKKSGSDEGKLTTTQMAILRWMKGLGVTVPPPAPSPDNGTSTPRAMTARDVVVAMRDGYLLCRLVECIGKKTISGVKPWPKTTAGMMNNVSKALSCLRQDVTSVSESWSGWLWSVDAFVASDSAAVWGLLYDIWRKYSVGGTQAQTTSKSGLTAPLFNRTSNANSNSNSNSPTRPASTPKKRPVSQESLTRSPSFSWRVGAAGRSPRKTQRDVTFWLSSLGVPTQFANNLSALEDPLRNGILLAEIAEIVEGCSVRGIKAKPATVAEASKNITLALDHFSRKHLLPAPLHLATNGIVQGDKDLLWNVVWHIREAYSDVQGLANSVNRSSKTDNLYTCLQMPYGRQEMAKLEASLMHWLVDLGVITKTPSVATIDDIIPSIKEGIVLAEIASKALKIRVQRLNLRPRTEVLCEGNIEKVCNALMSVKGMSHRYLHSAAKIASGHKGVICGLLEDIRRCSDGVHPRPDKPLPNEKPYLGLNTIHVSTVRKDFTDALALHSQGMLTAKELLASPNRGLLKSQDGWLGRTDNALLLAAARKMDNTPLTASLSSVKKTKNNNNTATSDPRPFRMLHWLQALGFLPNGDLEDMYEGIRTGVLLCDVVGKLERSDIGGIERNPKANANWLHNIRKALEQLRKNRSMAVRHLFAENLISAGNTVVMIELLEDMKKCYGSRGLTPKRTAAH